MNSAVILPQAQRDGWVPSAEGTVEKETRSLAPEHREDLGKSGLVEETIRRCDFRSVRPHDIKVLHGVESAYEIPYFSLDGKQTGHVRRRLFPPRQVGGNSQKYDQEKGTTPQLYIPPLTPWTQIACDPANPVVLAEGEKKAAAMSQAGVPTLGVGGVWNWRQKLQDGASLVLPTLDQFVWKGRTAELAPDSDVWRPEKQQAFQGFYALGMELVQRGATVRFVVLPETGQGKVGLDDFLVKSGAQWKEHWTSLERITLDHPRLVKVATWWQGWQKRQALASEETTVIPLDDVTLPPFPIDAFPDPLRSMIEGVAKATETPVELGAMMGLTTIATCCQKSFEVVIDKSYREPLSIWGVTALESGNRKTAVHQKMTEPLRVKERDLCDQNKVAIAQAESKRATTEACVKAIRTRIANFEGSEDIVKEKREKGQKEIDRLLASEMPEVPIAPRLWAQDITPEKLGAVMADNGERLGLLSDEGGLFDILAGRYSNGVPNLDLFLQSHAGAPVRVDRGSRPSLVMHRPALTIGLSPQPGVLRGLTGKPCFRERGLLARFLYTLPPSPLGYRHLRTEPVPAHVLTAYHELIMALLRFEPVRNEYADTVPFLIRLSDAAEEERREFAVRVEANMRPNGVYEHLKDWAGKLPGAALRVAGIFHCIQHAHSQPQDAPISLETMRAAVTVLTVIGQHTKAVFDLMGADPALDGARRVWRWIEVNRQHQFTARECFQSLRGSFPRMADLNPALSVLCERGYLLPEDDSQQGVGRPRRPFKVNPVLTKGWT